ncbi:MT-A70 family [Pseudomassariella vexata]|uniref:MT-A70 family n=1 Tax=Pseudomassariella vexata TaxID=1141098 RepID=A0A1Y2DV49_9PEZI|nr:MT-A70 family [Pseudomassariella vexata]ORY63162.1 MT-A70 family [Pseudomassariella vexata]
MAGSVDAGVRLSSPATKPMSCGDMTSCTLFRSTDNLVVVIDIPRSIEEAQVLPGELPARRLISSRPPHTPWQTATPKKLQHTDVPKPASAIIGELMVLERVKGALEQVAELYSGPWCMPRIYEAKECQSPSGKPRKRKRPASETTARNVADTKVSPYLPTKSHHLLGTVKSLRDTFLATAPTFDVMVIDPPWPSRSVKRKKDGYTIAYSMEDAGRLLSMIPVASHLAPTGLVAVWVTNKPATVELLTSPRGIFSQWGLELVCEWVWVKVTSSGVPIIDINSTWRKPWERLLIARKGGHPNLSLQPKIILGVPDLHSRKPNLRSLFDEIIPSGYRGLEVFARNSTAGWWSWGDQALVFQERHHWVHKGEPEGFDGASMVAEPQSNNS